VLLFLCWIVAWNEYILWNAEEIYMSATHASTTIKRAEEYMRLVSVPLVTSVMVLDCLMEGSIIRRRMLKLHLTFLFVHPAESLAGGP